MRYLGGGAGDGGADTVGTDVAAVSHIENAVMMGEESR